MTIEVRDSLRAIRVGREPAKEVIPEAAKRLTQADSLITHASTSSCGRNSVPRSTRWVIDSGPCVDLIEEFTITDSEQDNITLK